MLEGEWLITAVEYAGEPMPGRTGRLQIIGDRFAMQMGGAPREVGRVEYDEGSFPARLDLIWRDPDGGEARRLRSIVRVRGQLMQFCYFPENSDARPMRFVSESSELHAPAIIVRCRKEPA